MKKIIKSRMIIECEYPTCKTKCHRKGSKKYRSHKKKVIITKIHKLKAYMRMLQVQVTYKKDKYTKESIIKFKKRIKEMKQEINEYMDEYNQLAIKDKLNDQIFKENDKFR